MKRTFFALLAAACAAAPASRAHVPPAYDGPAAEYRAWRGETLITRIAEDWPEKQFVEFVRRGEMPAGIDVRLGVAEPVMYRPNPRDMAFAARFDTVAWCDGASPGDFSRIASCGPLVARISVGESVKPGEYPLGGIKLKVLDRVLPKPSEWKYHLDLWQHPWAVARYWDCEMFDEKFYSRMGPVLDTLAECGIKNLTVTITDYPWNHQCYDEYMSMIGRVKLPDGKWKFDYAKFDEYVEFGLSRIPGANIACYTMCPWSYKVYYGDSDGARHIETAKPGTPEFEDFWGYFLVDFAKHLKDKGWFSRTYIAMDERSPEDVKAIADFIQARAPGMKIAMAGNRKPSDFEGITIDNYSQYLSHATPEFLAETAERRKKGFLTTYYVCCGPGKPNTFMSSPDPEGFWLGVFPALAGLDGFLRWAANSWPRNPYEDATFREWWAAGDTYLVYPKGEYSMRLVNLREGIVAAEKMRILRESGEFREDLDKLCADFGDFRKALEGDFGFFANCASKTKEIVNRDSAK